MPTVEAPAFETAIGEANAELAKILQSRTNGSYTFTAAFSGYQVRFTVEVTRWEADTLSVVEVAAHYPNGEFNFYATRDAAQELFNGTAGASGLHKGDSCHFFAVND